MRLTGRLPGRARHDRGAAALRRGASWASRRRSGAALPRADLRASLVRVDTHRFLVYGNYEALLAYNCAHTYALSVGLLADRIGTRCEARPTP